MKDPFEAACEEQESPPDSPSPPEDGNAATGGRGETEGGEEEAEEQLLADARPRPVAAAAPATGGAGKGGSGRAKEEEDEEEDEEHMDVEISKFPSGDPDKLSKMELILAQFTGEQMSRYESFRRSNFQKSNMRRVMWISVPLLLFFKEMECCLPTAIDKHNRKSENFYANDDCGKIVMSERKETGPIRPCHIREAYRRLKLEGKVPKRSVRRLFR
ncbi:hypothetical protein Taro_039524 [Colocasia esculenta]|uniref:TAFII28-like protein domain-containing protein n=1 Tax=Colocasia esculenta TaxID=4460 RepID=A0A843WJ54_COLES|nr:hypothetical protein [Colocasia esculenta]